ncbi:GATA zinc finger domain-containing protein 14-like [Helianthus annuus]|uniref:GATA zinc finger domain-containing protein 14-like n=1 Tax=Helianthus annuus TaxID=4232 RepID=UPI000B8FB950|nr:GATA zinc finger domain-containing protein 14-like [Helianthus annuus]
MSLKAVQKLVHSRGSGNFNSSGPDKLNDGYGNNRNPRNNNQRNQNDGFYNNNNNNVSPNRIPLFVGGGNQGGNRGGDRRDNRRPVDQEVNGPHRQQPPREVNDRFRPVVTDNDSPIVCKRRMFDCKPHYINILPNFNGRSNDEPYTHLAEFSAICSTIWGHDFALEEVKLRLFQLSLKDKAKQWFLTLPANSIRTWGEMQQVFLDEYYSMVKTNDARDEIRSFHQLSSEPLHEAFTRYKELIRKCPHHQIEKLELVKCFVRGLDDETWNHLESTSNGTLLSNYEDDDWEFLERMSKRSKSKESADRAKKHPVSQSLPDLDSKDRISNLERDGMNSNTYHPGLRNHPNFRYGNASNQMNPNFQSGNQGGQGNYQRGYNQSGNGGGTSNSQGDDSLNSKLDAIMNAITNSNQEIKAKMKKEFEVRDKSHKALEKQVGQLAQETA